MYNTSTVTACKIPFTLQISGHLGIHVIVYTPVWDMKYNTSTLAAGKIPIFYLTNMKLYTMAHNFIMMDKELVFELTLTYFRNLLKFQ